MTKFNYHSHLSLSLSVAFLSLDFAVQWWHLKRCRSISRESDLHNLKRKNKNSLQFWIDFASWNSFQHFDLLEERRFFFQKLGQTIGLAVTSRVDASKNFDGSSTKRTNQSRFRFQTQAKLRHWRYAMPIGSIVLSQRCWHSKRRRRLDETFRISERPVRFVKVIDAVWIFLF